MTLSTMTFGEAVEAMRRGEKVRRAGWHDDSSYLFIDDDEIVAAAGGIALPWMSPKRDTESNDWTIC